MPKAKKGFYEIGPGWPGATSVPMKMDGWSGNLTNSMSFEYLEKYYGDKIANEGRLETKPRTIPDLIHAVGYTPIVTSAIKSVLEAVAPGEAEFRQFALQWQNGRPVPGEHYIRNILNRVDCLDLARTGEKRPEVLTHSPSGEPLTPEDSWLREAATNFVSSPVEYIDPAAVGDLHIWRPRWRARMIFVTSDLLHALRNAGVKGLRTKRLKTSEQP